MEKVKNTILVKSNLLKWARESIGFSFEETNKITKIPIEKIKEWEEIDSEIKITDIKKIAKAYKRTLSFFFLQNPPEVNPIPKDFRTLDSVDINTLSSEVRLAIRKAQRNRRFYSYLLDVTETDQIKLPKISFDSDVNELSIRLRKYLDIKIEEQKEEWENESFAFNKWINVLEDKGVPVFQIALPIKEIRGFCLRENNLPPIIVLNSRDIIRGRIFTLFHEFYHLLLSQNDIDSLTRTKGESMAHKLIEMKANEFAGSFLVPNDDFISCDLTKRYIKSKEDRYITNLVNLYKVSYEVIYRRLLKFGYMTEQEYKNKREELRKKYEQDEIKKKKKREESTKPFIPDYYRDVLKASSYNLSKKAFSAMSEGKISTNELVTFLDVKLSSLKKIQNKASEYFNKQIRIPS